MTASPPLTKHAHTALAVISRMPKLIILCTCQQMRTPTSIRSHPHTHYTGAVYPTEDRDVGPCRPMSVLGEGKYFHCEGIFWCQQSDRALGRDRRFPWGLWPQERRGRRGGILRERRGGLVVPRYQEHGECQHLQGGTDRVRSGCDRRAIATVIQVILHWDIQSLFHCASCRTIFIYSLKPGLIFFFVKCFTFSMHHKIPTWKC